MPAFVSTPEDPYPPNTRSIRWIALLLASVLLHVVAFNWAGGHIGLPSHPDEQPAVISTRLLAPPAPKPAAARPRPKARPRPAPEPKPPAPVVDSVATLPPAVVDSGTEADALPPAAEAVVVTPQEAMAPVPVPEPEPEPEPYRFNPPPSAELSYAVHAVREQNNWHGNGMFRWESDGERYRIHGEAGVRFIFQITVLDFSSEGRIADFGIAPVLYSEKPWRKSLTNTHFQHEQQKISFSASTAIYPYHGGEQDRASIMWQLAGIGRAAPDRFQTGADIDIVVAGARDAVTWRIRVVGEEEIDTPYGRFSAWHVTRVPDQRSRDQQIDIWLAPQQEWYPVKVRHTYANGDFLDMTLSDLVPLAAR